MATSPPSGGLEKHVQTIGVSLITAAILFTAGFTYNTSQANAEMAVELKYMRIQLTDMKTKLEEMNNTYVKREEFMDHEGRIRRLEGTPPVKDTRPFRGGR